MKLIQSFLPGILLLALASQAVRADDPTVIRITGAQGLRAAVHKAVGNILSPGYSVGYAGTSLSTAMQAVFTGTTITGSYSVVIKTSYGTSTAGIRTMVTGTTIGTWLTAVSGTVGNLTANETTAVTADATVSGEYQATTRFKSPSLSDTLIGVFPYVWVRNAGSPATLSSINSTLAQALFPTGQMPLSQFTGSTADSETVVTLIGRDEGASSREALFAESGFGIYSSPFQYKLSITGTPGPTGTVTGCTAYPLATVDGITYSAGHSGYSSFSTLVAALNTPNSLAKTGGWVVGYSDIIDAVTVNPGVVATASAAISGGTVSNIAVTNGGTNYNDCPIITLSGGNGTGAAAKATVVNGVITAITVTSAGTGYTSVPTVSVTGGALMGWNGVPYSTTAVEQGQYTYWSYAHMMYRTSLASTSTTKKAVLDQLANRLINYDIVEGGNSMLGSMQVSRSGDGSPVVWGAK